MPLGTTCEKNLTPVVPKGTFVITKLAFLFYFELNSKREKILSKNPLPFVFSDEVEINSTKITSPYKPPIMNFLDTSLSADFTLNSYKPSE